MRNFSRVGFLSIVLIVTTLSALGLGCGGSSGGGGANTLSSIAVTPANPSITIASTKQFIATGTYSDGSTAVITTSVTWTSSNTAFATIGSKTGLATAVATGAATITATLGTTSGNTVLTVSGQSALNDVDLVFADGSNDLCGMKIDGTGKVILKAGATFDDYDYFTQMAFSADGNYIAYLTIGGTPQIRVMGNGLGDPTTLAPTITGLTGVSQPAFSPDGTKIAFIGSYFTTGAKGEFVSIMNADGTSARRVSPDYGTLNPGEASPSFSADGSLIVFTTNRIGAVQLATITLDGATMNRFDGGTLGSDPVPAYPTVDTVSDTIYYSSAQVSVLSNEENIYNISLTGTGKAGPLTNSSTYNLERPSVSNDGTKVVFTMVTGMATASIQILDLATSVVTTISNPIFSTYNDYPVFVRR